MRTLEMAAKGAGISLLKQGWQEVPDLVGSLGLGVLGIFVGGIAFIRHNSLGDKANMYKIKYTVIRSTEVDDPKKLGTIYN
ncbi:hypothetical protein LSAT2_014674 [Lamellibrachia satsuma]|nr:hypothetical protein LSAT2_014674 [Lamellibrachia satsuma]